MFCYVLKSANVTSLHMYENARKYHIHTYDMTSFILLQSYPLRRHNSLVENQTRLAKVLDTILLSGYILFE